MKTQARKKCAPQSFHMLALWHGVWMVMTAVISIPTFAQAQPRSDYAAKTLHDKKISIESSEISQDFWQQDIWRNHQRPFLFYGEPDKDKMEPKRLQDQKLNAMKSQKGQDDPTQAFEKRSKAFLEHLKTSALSLQTEGVATQTLAEGLTKEEEAWGEQLLIQTPDLEALKQHVQARLSLAVMQPSPKTVAAYMQANAYLLEKAGRFAAMWQHTLTQAPQFDWTAQHPTVNRTSIALKEEREATDRSRLLSAKADWGLLVLLDDSVMSSHLLDAAVALTDRMGWECEWVSIQPNNSRFPDAVEAPELANVVAGGLSLFPSVVLVHRGDPNLKSARLLATGVVSVRELERRIAQRLQLEAERNIPMNTTNVSVEAMH